MNIYANCCCCCRLFSVRYRSRSHIRYFSESISMMSMMFNSRRGKLHQIDKDQIEEKRHEREHTYTRIGIKK